MIPKMSTKTLVISGLLIALTCVSTMIIKIPTPSMGYIHPGDGFVLLCGFLLGPFLGGICAGLGSAFADLFSGYIIYVPATFIIKAICAFLAGFILQKMQTPEIINRKKTATGMILGGIIGELFMVAGYFIYEAFMIGATVGAAAALEGVPFNLVQGVSGVIIACVIYPVIAPAYKRITA